LSNNKKSRELEEELEATLNFSRRTITFTTKPISHVIVISYLKEEVEIRPQPIVEEQPQLVPTSKPMEEKEV
jgi:hypothetical protein